MEYTKPLNQIDLNASYNNANPTEGLRGSIVPAEAIEAPQREIIAVIESAEITPSKSDKTQLLKAILALIERGIEDKPSYEEVNQKLSLKADKQEAVLSEEIRRMKEITQQDYEALTIKDPNALYVILGA